MTSRRLQSRISPLALAALMALGTTGLNAAPRTYVGPGSFWDVVDNWTGGIVPGAADDALLGAFNTEVRTTFTINSFIGTGSLTVSAGTLSFGAASSIGSLNLTGGTLAGNGSLVVAGPSTWTAGNMTGTGATTFAGSLALGGGGVMDITSGRTVNFNGTTTWSNASDNAGRLRTGSSTTLNNNGTWLDQNNFNNQISPDFGGPSTFVNAGSYTKSGAATTSISVGFNNTSTGAGTGVVNVNAGTLQLGGGGTSNGSFAGTGTLQFSGGTHTLQAASSVGNSNVTFSSGTVDLAGSYNVSGTTAFTGGTANFTGSVANSGGALTLSASGGAANFSNSAGVQFSSLNMQAGTIGGTQTVTFTGPSTWSGGTMTGAGSTIFAGALALSGGSVMDITNGRTINFNGTTTWSNASEGAGRLRTGSNTTLNNNGTWLDQNNFNNQISPDFGGPSTFVNAGSYTKSGAGTTSINVGFNNTSTGAGTGVVNVNAGTLQLGGGGTSNGSFAGTGTLQFSGGTHTLQAASSVGNSNVTFSSGTVDLAGSYNVSGTTAFTGGTANFTGSVANSGGALTLSAGGGAANFSNSAGVQFSSLNMQAGTIGGTQTVTFTGPSTWSGGTMTSAGSTTFAGALALSGPSVIDITNGRTINFNGTTTWSNASEGAGRLRTGSNTTLNNNGTWRDQNAFNNSMSPDFGGPSTFVNVATYTKTGAGTTSLGVGFDNTATGTVNLNAGNLELYGGGGSAGAINIASGAVLRFNGGTYTLGGTISGTASGRLLTASGTVTSTTVKNFGGSLEVVGGTFNADSAFTTAVYLQSAGTVGGTGTLTVTGPATWSGGAMTGAGSTTFASALALSGGSVMDINNGRTVNFNGTTTWSNASEGAGRLRTGSNTTLNNNGTWLDQNAFNNSMSPDLGGPSTFVNAGSYTKSGAGTTSIGVGFDNAATGTVNLNAGNLELYGGGSSVGAINIASGTALRFTGGTYTLGGTISGTTSGRLLTASGTVTNTTVKNFGGSLEVVGGTFNADSAFTTAVYLQSAGTVGGTGTLTVTGPATWSGGTMTGAGSTTFAGALALSGPSVMDINNGRTVNFNGTTTWTNASDGAGRLRTGSNTTLNNNGTWLDQNAFNNSMSPDLGGPSTFVNAGTYTKSGAATTSIGVGFNNTGSVNVNAGTLTLTGSLSNFSGTTLTGGNFNVTGASIFSFNGANVVTNAAGIRLDGAGAQFLNASGGTNGLVNLAANTAAGSFTIRNGRSFTTVGAFDNAGIVNVGPSSTFTGGGLFTNQTTGQLQMAGGSYAGPSLANSGVLSGFGAVAPVVSNSGTVRASGGTLTLAQGTLGATGTVLVDTGATLALGATSTARNLTHNGTLLALGTNDITVFNDYENTNFGVGNSFDRRAGVSGAGQILASGTAQQILSGALVTGGNTGSATMTLPNSRVGLGGISTTFTIANTGLGGPSLRGALVTTGISNPGLSGSGVTAQNWGAISQLDPGQTFTVTFDPTFGQALSGQVLQVVNNFDNVAGQSLAITGQAFNLAGASAATPNPVVFANQRVGGTLSQSLTISNIAPNSGFSERLNATIAASGTATAGGSFNLLAAGASSSDLFVGVDTTSAGAKAGTATITLASDGTGTSGFSPLTLSSQTVNVSGDVYRLASASAVTPSPVVFANQRVGGTLSQALSFTNTAAADGFSERLNATIAASGTATAGGAFNLLGAGASSSALFVGVDTTTAGAKSGTATITLASDGTGTSGFSPLALTSQNVAVSGDVYRLASASAVTPSPVVFANQRVGGSLSQALSFTNTAANDGFSERLNATIAASGTATAGGAFNLLGAGASSNALFVGVDATTAGAKSGTAIITLASDGTGTSGFSPLALASQSVNVSGNVFRLAQASNVIPNVVLLGNLREGGLITQALTLSNLAAADGFSESLNASIAGSGGIVTGGSFSQLAAGNSSSTLFVGVDASTAGVKGGTATITLASDGAGTSGLAPFALGTQVVNVSATVFRLASASAASPNPVTLANQRIGGTLTQALSLTNTAAPDSFSEALNATIAASGTATAGGSFSLLAAGASSSALFVGVDTSSAGAKGGTATITLSSDGSGGSGFGTAALGTQAVAVSGNVYRLAQAGLATPGAVTLADQRIGGSLTQGLSLANLAAADSFSERLNASIAASGAATAGGSFTLLAAGDTSTTLNVGVDTSSAGAKSGSALITLASDGSGTSGFSAAALGTQAINVAGNVYRLAQPVVDTTPLVMIGRVGDATLTAGIAVNNNAPDAFTERLNASIGASPAGINAGPALIGLAPNAGGSLQLSLNTGTAGSFSGNVGVALVSSSAGTTSGAPDASLGSVNVALTGRVYAPAVAQVAPTVVDFGTVRVGDVVSARTVTVGNGASGALTDTLRATLSGGASPFAASGTVASLAAGASDNTSLRVDLSTGAAGVFASNTTVQLTSQNPDLADLALAPVSVVLQGQVNNLARGVLSQSAGSGSFSGGAFSYTLDFGTVVTEGGTLTANLVLGNAALGTADALAGSWALGTGGAFSVAGFGPFSGLAAGAALAGLTVTFDLGTEGNFGRTLVLSSLSTNGSGPDLALGDITLQLQGTVVAVPEPSIYLMMALGVFAIGGVARRRLKAADAR